MIIPTNMPVIICSSTVLHCGSYAERIGFHFSIWIQLVLELSQLVQILAALEESEDQSSLYHGPEIMLHLFLHYKQVLLFVKCF